MTQTEFRAKKIEEILNSKQYNGENFYDLMQYKKNNVSNFNDNNYMELIYKVMYLYHQKFGIDKLTEKKSKDLKIPLTIKKNISYENFILEIEKLKKYPSKFPEYYQNYYDFIIQTAGNLIGLGDWGWLRIYANKINNEKENTNIIGKIYLSIKNKDLHKFANIFLQKCITNDITDYEFKIHNDDETERQDSVVIYYTEKNFPKYIKIIEEIKKEEPTLQFNSPNFLAHQYNEYISIAQDMRNTTFSELAQIAINTAKEQGKTTNKDIALCASQIIESYIQEKLGNLIQLCEKNKKTPSNNQINSSQKNNNDIFIYYNPNDEFNKLEIRSFALIWDYPNYAPHITIYNDKKEYFIKKGHEILNNDMLNLKWNNFLESLPNKNGYLIDETLYIMTILKAGTSFEQVKEILQKIKNYDIVLTYLSNFINPEVLKKINPNSTKLSK